MAVHPRIQPDLLDDRLEPGGALQGLREGIEPLLDGLGDGKAPDERVADLLLLDDYQVGGLILGGVRVFIRIGPKWRGVAGSYYREGFTV